MEKSPRQQPTPASQATASRRPKTCVKFFADSRKARRLAFHLFTTQADSVKGNAFQHSFWHALMVNSIGKAADFPLALDFGVRMEDHRWRDAETDERRLASYMDLTNNALGYYRATAEGTEHSDRFFCHIIVDLVNQGRYSRERSEWAQTGKPIWIKSGSRFRSARTCEPAE